MFEATVHQVCETVQEGWVREFERWLGATGRKGGRSASSVRSHLQDLSVFMRWFAAHCGEGFTPERLNAFDLRTFRVWSVRRCAAATWNRRRTTLELLCAWAREAELISIYAGDPMQGVLPKEQTELAPRWLTNPEFLRVIRYVGTMVNFADTDLRRWRAARDAALVGLMVFAGLRVAEVCALDFGDVEISERKGLVYVRSGKGDKARKVPISSEGRRLLAAWLEMRQVDGGALFVGDRGERMTTRAVQKRFQRIAEAAGIEGLTPHVLRHTCAKRMVDAGRPLTEVKAILGHAKLDMTERYVKPGLEDLERAVEAIAMGGMADGR